MELSKVIHIAKMEIPDSKWCPDLHEVTQFKSARSKNKTKF